MTKNITDASQTTDSLADDPPLVTVVVTTYNRPNYLPRAVETVVGQSYDNVELVVVDDCSETPATAVLDGVSPDVREFRVIRHQTNKGPNAARNTGVEAASGEYVAFLDDDDRWEPEKLARQVGVFESGPDEMGVVSVGWKRIDDDGRVDTTWLPPEVDGDVTKALLCRNVVGTQSAVMVRADVAKDTAFDDRFPRWADLEWYVSLSTKCTFDRIREPLVIHEFETHNRIQDDFDKLSEGHRLFVDKYAPLAREYGRLMERKMRGWAEYRVGSAFLVDENYSEGRRHLLAAVRWYPLELRFYLYAGAVLGGRTTHQTAQSFKELLPGSVAP